MIWLLQWIQQASPEDKTINFYDIVQQNIIPVTLLLVPTIDVPKVNRAFTLFRTLIDKRYLPQFLPHKKILHYSMTRHVINDCKKQAYYHDIILIYIMAAPTV